MIRMTGEGEREAATITSYTSKATSLYIPQHCFEIAQNEANSNQDNQHLVL